jgi:hypothetical protein
MNKDILNNYNAKEKKTLDTYIVNKGYKIKVYLAEPTDNNASEIEGVEWISSTHGEINVSDTPSEDIRSIVLLNDEFNFQEINISILLDEGNNNFNNFYGLINGDTLPKGSVVKFVDFNIRLTVQRVEKNRALSSVERYVFVR